jgi:hypothetical protein
VDASLLIGAPLGLGILIALGIFMMAMSHLTVRGRVNRDQANLRLGASSRSTCPPSALPARRTGEDTLRASQSSLWAFKAHREQIAAER